MFDTNLTVPLHLVTKAITAIAKNSHSTVERGCVYEITQAIGAGLKQSTPGFNEGEFLKECGVSPTWATQAA